MSFFLAVASQTSSCYLRQDGLEGDVTLLNVFRENALIVSLEIGDEELAEIGLILEMHRNFSISVYKDKCMKRRVAIRMRSCRCLDAAAYCNLLRHSEQELDLLKKTLTIHVSQFFRNPSMFTKLQTDIFPYLFHKARTERKNLRFRSLGCAGGEEAYSLGIILREFFPLELLQTPTEICASDIDADILQVAMRAEYIEERLKDLPDNIRDRYFVPNGSRMLLSQDIRNMVSFHQQSIIDVDSFEPCQLALCRNTLIYFTKPEQERILRGIAHIMPVGGILVLGKSETLVGDTRKLFTNVCQIERIYRRI